MSSFLKTVCPKALNYFLSANIYSVRNVLLFRWKDFFFLFTFTLFYTSQTKIKRQVFALFPNFDICLT